MTIYEELLKYMTFLLSYVQLLQNCRAIVLENPNFKKKFTPFNTFSIALYCRYLLIIYYSH